MTADERLRAALRSSAARVVVDEDAAWQQIRAQLETPARPGLRNRSPGPAWPGSRRGPLAVGLAAVAVVAVAVSGFWLVTRDEGTQSNISAHPTTTAAGVATPPSTAFDHLTPGQDISADDWVAAGHALATARGNVSGDVDVVLQSGTPVESATPLTFTVDGDGQFAIDDSASSILGLVDGTTVTVDNPRRVVLVHRNGASDVLAPSTLIGGIVRPDRWIESLAAAGPVAISYKGRETIGGRSVLQFSVLDPGGGASWDIDLDAATGVLLRSLAHSVVVGKPQEQETTVRDFSDAARRLANDSVSMPEGFGIEALIDTPSGAQPYRGVVPADATVGSVIAQVNAAVPS